MTGVLMLTKGGSGCRGEGKTTTAKGAASSHHQQQQNQLSLLALLISAIRKSMVSCKVDQSDEVVSNVQQMEIGWPTNVRHITHVTFDRFNGFLGLPVEFEVEVPGRVPSASASVFGVSAESMQCTYDSKGNSVPTILLLMQERLYSQGGLKAEGIFRINPENSKEEHVRDQLNRGIVPNDIDVHCLAGLIKAWFRELPEGILDGLSPEQVLQCNTEDQCVELVKELLPIPAGLLNWAIDLMADVVEEEVVNKMNARNIAMVFAPNMTQMSDPLTALMHAVQVMNLLKALILKTLREREENAAGGYSPCSSHCSDRRTDDDFDDSQQEMDTSCELRGANSDYENHESYSQISEDEEEAETLNEIEECFLRQLDEKQELIDDIPMTHSHVSSSNCSGFNAESSLTFCDGKNGTSDLSTSDVEDSVTSMVAAKGGDTTNTSNVENSVTSMVAAKGGDPTSTDDPCEDNTDVEMTEKQADFCHDLGSSPLHVG